jgi:hypothetical protein
MHQLGRVNVEEDPAHAMRLMGAATGYMERTGTVLPPFVQRRTDTARQRAAQLLGAQATQKAFEEGRRMSLDEAIAFAAAASESRAPNGA